MKNLPKHLFTTALCLSLLIMATGCGKENGGQDSWIDFAGVKAYQFSTAQVVHVDSSATSGDFDYSHSWGFLFVAAKNQQVLAVTIAGFLTKGNDPGGSYRITADAGEITNENAGTVCGPGCIVQHGLTTYYITGGTLTVNKSGDSWEISVKNATAQSAGGTSRENVSFTYKGKLTLSQGSDPI